MSKKRLLKKQIAENLSSSYDIQGSYTGKPLEDEDYRPIQDADDL